jgi:hypothetical protein
MSKQEIKKEMAVFQKALKLAIENQADRINSERLDLIGALKQEIANYEAWLDDLDNE